MKSKGKTTEGIFAPWAFWKKDFQEIGGHDPIFAPQSKEDTDILEMWNDQFNCEEWFNALHTLDRSVVDRIINNLK